MNQYTAVAAALIKQPKRQRNVIKRAKPVSDGISNGTRMNWTSAQPTVQPTSHGSKDMTKKVLKVVSAIACLKFLRSYRITEFDRHLPDS